MAFPQPNTGILQEFANFVTVKVAYTAKAGDVVLADTTTTGAVIVTLPPVTQGASVIVKCTAYTDELSIVTADGSTVDGFTGTTGVVLAAVNDAAWFVSDSTAWHVFSLGALDAEA